MSLKAEVNSDERVEFIFNDYVVRPDICNFSCDYCLSNEAPEWQIHASEKGSGPTDPSGCNLDSTKCREALVYRCDTPLGQRMELVIDRYNSFADAAILRISGGEILQIKGITDFLKNRTEYEAIQIITNGYFLTENILSELKKLNCCHIHLSLDGHSLELNKYRVKREEIQQRLLNNLKCAVNMGFDVEIGSVLTDANTKNYRDFLDYLLRFEGRVSAYPFPIRGGIQAKYYPDNSSIEAFAAILQDYSKYAGVLAHKGYIEETVRILLNGKRELRCHIPAAMTQLFDDGNLTPCPNAWTTCLGNVLKSEGNDIIARIKNDKMYNLFMQKRPRLSYCKHCFTSLDIVNLFIEGRIKDDEIARIPLYSGFKTRERLKRLKLNQ